MILTYHQKDLIMIRQDLFLARAQALSKSRALCARPNIGFLNLLAILSIISVASYGTLRAFCLVVNNVNFKTL